MSCPVIRRKAQCTHCGSLVNKSKEGTLHDKCRLRLTRIKLSPFQEQHHQLIRADDASRKIAAALMRLHKESYFAEAIGGQVTQYDLSIEAFLQSELGQQLRGLVHSRARSIGINPDDLHLVSPKLLLARTGTGEQAIHWDHIDGPVLRPGSASFYTAALDLTRQPFRSSVSIKCQQSLLKPCESVPISSTRTTSSPWRCTVEISSDRSSLRHAKHEHGAPRCFLRHSF
jgi:hypothetical protein